MGMGVTSESRGVLSKELGHANDSIITRWVYLDIQDLELRIRHLLPRGAYLDARRIGTVGRARVVAANSDGPTDDC